jgi:hypothetical protein
MNTHSPIDDDGPDYFTCSTLIDITKTDAVRHYNHGMDDSQIDYDAKRNQHRNWQSFLQVLGLRCQPTNMTIPSVKADQDLSAFGSEYTTGKIWTFHFNVEQEGVLDLPGKPAGLLLEDLHNVPIITGLTSDVTIMTAMLDTVSVAYKNTIILK